MADIGEIIRRTVQREFPGVSDPFQFTLPTQYSQLNANAGESNDNDSGAVNDGSGRRFFVIGASEWGGDNLIAE
jgi:hypothetical protein